MFSDMHIVAGMSRSIDLLEQSQKIACIGAWEWLVDDDKALWTDQMFELLELEKTEDNMMPFDAVFRHVHPEDRLEVANLRAELHDNETLLFHHRWITASGNTLYIQCWCERHFSHGRLFKIRGTCQDITPFKKMEEDLATKTAALLRAEEFADIGSYQVNFTTGTIFYSDNLYRIYGYEPGEVPSEYQYFNSLVHPEDSDFVMDLYQKLMSSPGEHDALFRIIRRDGSLRYLHAKGKSFTTKNGETILAGTTKDVTNSVVLEDNLERQNNMLQQAEETAKLGSWKYNFVSRQLSFSDNLYKLLGYEVRAFENDVTPVFELLPPEDVEAVYATYRATISDKKERSVRFRVNRKDGMLRFFTSSGKMTTNRKGEEIIVGTVQDITEEHELRARMEEQNDFIQKLIDSSVNYISVVDKQKKYTLWNRKCEEIYGLKKEEVIGRTLQEVYKGMDITWLEQAVDRALQGEKVQLNGIPSATGRFFEIHLIPLADVNGANEHVFILAHDISELTLLNARIKEQKDFAEAVVDHSQACIFGFDRELKLLVWNRKCEELYGIPRQSALGKTLAEVFNQADVEVPTERVRKAFEGETIHYPAEPSRVIDRYYDSYVIPMKDEQGNINSVLCVLNDVTEVININTRIKEANRLLEQKKNELSERTTFLETLLDISADYIGVYDQDFRVLVLNEASCKRYGIHKNEAIGKTVFELFPGIEHTPAMESLRTAMQGAVVRGLEFKSHKDDTVFSGSQVPLRDKDGEVFGVLAIAHDITEIKKAMQALEVLNNQLGAKNHELNRINSELASFSYVASHDLQEPLRKIQAFISLILAKDVANLSDNAQDYFRRIQASANRMQQMIDGLLSFSRTNTTEKRFEEKPLAPMLQKIWLRLQHEPAYADATLEIDTPHMVYAIPHQLEQLLEHVLGNALKFNQEGNAARVLVDSELVPGKDIEGEVAMRHKQYCRISVRDNGIGFDMQDAEKIFQMFQRLHGKNEYPGTGIGLAICRRIAQNHNGFITVESEPGAGSTFHIYLLHEPAAQA